MIKLDNLSLLVVVPDQGARAKLREILKSFLLRPNIIYDQTLKDAEAKIAKGHRYDAVFISYEIGQREINEALTRLKASVSLKLPPFIVTMRGQKGGATGVVELYMAGVTGFITEPYTADDIIELLTTVKENRQALELTNASQKVRKASSFVIAETKGLLNDLARIKVNGETGTGSTLKDVKKLSTVIKELHAQDPTEYLRALLVAFDKSAPPKESARIKKVKKAVKQCKHPGSVIKDIIIRKGLNLDHLMENLKTDVDLFVAFLDEKAALDESLSRELSRLFGRSPVEWMALQKEYNQYIEQVNKNS